MLPHSLTRICLTLTIMGSIWLLSGAGAWAEPNKPVELVNPQLEARLDEDPMSGYRQLQDALLTGIELPATATRYPIVRALRAFEAGESVCLFPSSIKAVVSLIDYPSEELIQSDPIDFVNSHLMTRSDKEIIRSFDDLKGLRLVSRAGLPIEKYIENHDQIKIVRTSNNESALRMLQAGRGDVLYGFYPDMVLIAEKLGFPTPYFDPDLILFETTTHVTCKKTPQTELFIAEVNKGITRLKATGELEAMLGPHAQLTAPENGASTENPLLHVDIVAAHLEGRLDDDPESGFNRLAAEIFPEDDATSYQRYPLARAIRFFADNDRVCMYPGSARAVQSLTDISPEKLVESAAIDRVSSHVFVRNGGQIHGAFDDLQGKSLAVQNGVEPSRYLRTLVNYEVVRVPDDLAGLRMVMAGRVDAMYGWYPDTFIIAEKNNLPLPDFNPDLVIFETTTHLVCKKFAGVRQLLTGVNKQIEALRQSGRLQAILGPHARIVE